MYYHAIGDMPTEKWHWWANMGYEYLMEKLIIPFINKQVVITGYRGENAILNLDSLSYLHIYKTESALSEEERGNLKLTIKDDNFKFKECTEEVIESALIDKSAIDSKSLLQNIFQPTKKQVFIIMKFKDKTLDSAYQGVIKPIVKRYKYKPLRIDEVQDSGKITDQILEEIGKSEIILADLSGERPNCYYEAGFAHAIGKEMIFTKRKGARVHFDLSAYRFIEWETEAELRKDLNKRFKSITQRLKLSIT